MTLSLPLSAGSVGWNSDGNPTALLGPTSMGRTLPRASLSWRCEETFSSSAEFLKSCPFVPEFAAQSSTQLCRVRVSSAPDPPG